MATKKDLVEAHAFSRRRLVTAFVSGAPGGREVEPVRPGRVLIGGAALSVLLLAGAAIAGFLVGRPPAGWLETGSFVISKDTGEQYVVMRGGEDPELQRVPNYVSAQLLLGKPDLTPYTVRDKYIRSVALGPDLGIESAPASLPDPEELIDYGWTACTADGSGVKVAIQEGPPEVTDAPGAAFLVRSGGRRWLIAPSPESAGRDGSAYRFRLPKDGVDAGTLANELDFGPVAPRVDREWLNLFPMGGTLDAGSFGVTRRGEVARYDDTETDLTAFRIGDLVVADDGTQYLLGDTGPERLAPFPALVYRTVVGPAEPLPDGLAAEFVDPAHPVEWPQDLPTAVDTSTVCAVLHPGPDGSPTRTLAVDPTGAAAVGDVPPGRHEVEVEPSGGAYVLSGGDVSVTEDGSRFVIDTKGSTYELVGPEVPGYIGYGEVDPPAVASAWLAFFEPGVPLSTNAARRVPADAPPPADDAADEAGGS